MNDATPELKPDRNPSAEGISMVLGFLVSGFLLFITAVLFMLCVSYWAQVTTRP